RLLERRHRARRRPRGAAAVRRGAVPRCAARVRLDAAPLAPRRAAHAPAAWRPNRWCPVETHTLVPLVHWLPRSAADRAMRTLRRENWDQLELLGKREVVALFPPAATA